MRWTDRLLRRRPESPTGPAVTEGQREAQSALSRAREAHRQVEERRHAVQRVVAGLASQREQNHLAELFRLTMEKRRSDGLGADH